MLCSSNDEILDANLCEMMNVRGGAWNFYENNMLSNICYEMCILNFNQFNVNDQNNKFFDLFYDWLTIHCRNFNQSSKFLHKIIDNRNNHNQHKYHDLSILIEFEYNIDVNNIDEAIMNETKISQIFDQNNGNVSLPFYLNLMYLKSKLYFKQCKYLHSCKILQYLIYLTNKYNINVLSIPYLLLLANVYLNMSQNKNNNSNNNNNNDNLISYVISLTMKSLNLCIQHNVQNKYYFECNLLLMKIHLYLKNYNNVKYLFYKNLPLIIQLTNENHCNGNSNSNTI